MKFCENNPGNCAIKHYGFVIYGKLTDYKISLCVFTGLDKLKASVFVTSKSFQKFEGKYQRLDSQHFTFNWAQKAWVLHEIRLEMLAREKQSSLCKLGGKWSAVNMTSVPYSQNLIFFITYDCAQ
jgi:hypothetical protein